MAEQKLAIGDKVEIFGSAEAQRYSGLVFEVLSEPFTIPSYKGTLVEIKCHETGKYFGGGYATEYLRKVV